MSRVRIGSLIALVGIGAMAGLQACTDDEAAVSAKPDAGADTSTPPPPPPPTDGGDASDGTVTYAIPAGGGSVDFTTPAGKVTFTFPASAGGKTITLSPSTAAALGWPADQFSTAIKMGPDGTRFTDPVAVKFDNKAAVGAVLSFADTGGKSPAFGLKFRETTGAFELTHFTTLVVVPPGKVCEQHTKMDQADSGLCPDAGATTHRSVFCSGGFPYCMRPQPTCCVDPTVDSGTTCSLAQPRYAIFVSPVEDTSFPHCTIDAGNWTGGDGGCLKENNYVFNYGALGNAGCDTTRACSNAVYALNCDGTTCSCLKPRDGGSPDAGTFPQGTTTCDNLTTMKTAYVKGCNFPPH